MDPRLKLNYYKKNEQEETYIEETRETVFKAWETDYKIIDSVNKQYDEIKDELFFYIF